MSKKRFTRQERKTIKTLDYAIDEPFPPSILIKLCECMGDIHRKDTKKSEIPLRVKGERENES